MNTALGYIYRTEEVEVDVTHNCVRRLGTDHVLRHQSFQVLLYLLERSGKLVSKEELTAEIWRDAAVTDNALTQCIAEIRKAFGDDSRNPTYIRTISRVGYSFMAPVELVLEDSISKFALPATHKIDAVPEIPALAVEPGTLQGLANHPSALIASKPEIPAPPSLSSARTSSRKKNYFAVGICCGVLILLGLLIGADRRDASNAQPVVPLTSGHSLAVMYFENESQRGEFDWLRQGLTDMMITDLSRSGELHVLSRQQLSLLVDSKDGQASLSQAMHVAQTIHAADFLTGSFCALDGQFRIDIQLHDARNGQIIFADHSVFPNPSSILSQVDVLAEHLANAMALNSITKPNIAEVTTNNVEAYQYYSLGVEKAQEFENSQALSLLKQATELDPGFAMAYARIGYAYALSDFAPEKGKPYFEKALQLSGHLSEKDRLSIQAWYAISKADYTTAAQTLSRISQLYPQETEAYSRLARLLRAEERPQEALAILHRGLEVNPDDKDLNNALGFVLLSLHRYPEAIDTYQRYVELAPNEPNAHDSLGMAYEQSGSYEDAVNEYNRALALNAEFEPSIIHLGDTYYQTGQYGKAVIQYQKYIQIANTTDAQALGYGNLALVYLAMNQMPEAERAAASELKSNPNAVWGSLVIALKKSDHATVEHLKQVLLKGIPTQERGTPGDQRTKFYYAGYIDLQEGNAQKALAEFSTALRHLPPSSGIDTYEDCLANAELQLGHFQEAATEFSRILQLNPNYPQARAHLAEAQTHLSEQKHST
jgi:tetratricopeptide (TPR) repeat protein/DNA-binding winged helix-turn-helix (wHTH) protein